MPVFAAIQLELETLLDRDTLPRLKRSAAFDRYIDIDPIVNQLNKRSGGGTGKVAQQSVRAADIRMSPILMPSPLMMRTKIGDNSAPTCVNAATVITVIPSPVDAIAAVVISPTSIIVISPADAGVDRVIDLDDADGDDRAADDHDDAAAAPSTDPSTFASPTAPSLLLLPIVTSTSTIDIIDELRPPPQLSD